MIINEHVRPPHGAADVDDIVAALVADFDEADALVVVPEDVTRLPAGAEVGVIHLDSGLEGGH